MINKYQVVWQKLGECVSRFITVLSNVITDVYDIITDLSNVITDLSTFISKVFFLDTQPVLLYNGNDGLNSFLKLVSERFFETVSETKKRAHEWAPIWVQNFNISEPVLSRVCTENSQPFSRS